jgi:hypothetical protein
VLLVVGLAAEPPITDGRSPVGQPWARHTIDGSSTEADGIRLADINGDGRLDVTTGWEEGGRVRTYLHPGPDAVRDPWPLTDVGSAPSAEDAVSADLDADGAVDVVASTEGRSARSICTGPDRRPDDVGPRPPAGAGASMDVRRAGRPRPRERTRPGRRRRDAHTAAVLRGEHPAFDNTDCPVTEPDPLNEIGILGDDAD